MHLLAVCSVVLVFAFPSSVATAGTKVFVAQAVPSTKQSSMDLIDHSPWHQLLQKYVNAAGQVNYGAWKSSRADQKTLDRYLGHLARASTSRHSHRNAQLAFWINAYNSVTIKGILREYPTTSIRNHTPKLFGYHIWNDLLLPVGDGVPVSLSEIEHKILREMNEPLIHFAIVCASRSCPRLLDEAYTARKINDQMAENAKHFFRDNHNFRFDQRRGLFHLSSIIKWFREDFGRNQAEVLEILAPYLPNPAAYQAALKNTVSVSYLDYDWSLNDQNTFRVRDSRY